MNIYEANMFDSKNEICANALKLDKQLTGSYTYHKVKIQVQG